MRNAAAAASHLRRGQHLEIPRSIIERRGEKDRPAANGAILYVLLRLSPTGIRKGVDDFAAVGALCRGHERPL